MEKVLVDKLVRQEHQHGFDHLRNILMISVVMYHVSGTYSSLTPYWPFHDGHSIFADFVRMFFDVFMMPTFFFIAGWFTLSSLRGKTSIQFIVAKLKRIGIPWLMAIVFLIPFLRFMGKARYFKATGRVFEETLLQNWFQYLAGIGTTKFGFLKGHVSQMHLWFLSLLLVFFLVVGLIGAFKFRWFEQLKARDLNNAPAMHPGWDLKILIGITSGISLIYFGMICLLPDFSWITVQLLLQIQPTKLIIYMGSFSLGILMSKYDFSRLYDSGSKLIKWVLIGIALSALFLFQAKTMYARIYDSNELSIVFLFGFAWVKQFLILSILMSLLSVATLLKGRTTWVSRSLAIQTYYIYIIHVPFVFNLQGFLMKEYSAGPISKGIITLTLVMIVSYLISLVINRFPKSFCLVCIAFFFMVGFQIL